MPRSFLYLFVLLAAALAAGAATAADIKVMISAGFFNVYADLGPAFEKLTGHKLITTWKDRGIVAPCAGKGLQVRIGL